MRSESDSAGKEDQRGSDESTPAVLTWKRIDVPGREEAVKQLTEEYFGDVIVKIKQLITKEKRNFGKAVKEKKHGNKA
jgi:hypothetical protein